jgi:thioester reductase-like protein
MANIWANVLEVDCVGIHDSFLELGGHSLLAVRLIAEVRAAFNVNLSLASIFALSTVELMAAFVSSGQTRKLYTLRPTREILLADATLPPEIVTTETRGLAVNGDVLMTGATGFLGRHLLLLLLQRTNARVHCLVRASSHDLARRRLRAALQLTGVEIANDRLNVVVGDLTLPVLGLSSEVWSLLSTRVAAIYHLGAMVNHLASYDLLRTANVQGTLEVLRLATSGSSKAVHFVSSVDIVDSQVANNVPLCDKPPLRVDPYTSSKWVADQLIAKADTRGTPVCIYRIGYIGPHSRSGNANPSGWFELYVQAMLKIRAIPADANEFSLTPVDLIVDSIFELSRDPTSLHQAFHLLDRELTVSPMTVMAAARSLGYVLEAIPGKAWRERLASYCAAHPDDPVGVLGPYLDALAAQESGERTTHRPVGPNCAAAHYPRTFDLDPAVVLRTFLRRTAMKSEDVLSSANGLFA